MTPKELMKNVCESGLDATEFGFIEFNDDPISELCSHIGDFNVAIAPKPYHNYVWLWLPATDVLPFQGPDAVVIVPDGQVPSIVYLFEFDSL